MKYIVLIGWCLFLSINPFLEEQYNVIANQLELFYVSFMLGYFGMVLNKNQFVKTSAAVYIYYLYIILTDSFIDYLTPYYNSFEVGLLFLIMINLIRENSQFDKNV